MLIVKLYVIRGIIKIILNLEPRQGKRPQRDTKPPQK